MEIIKFKAFSGLNEYSLCLGNISKDVSVGNMLKTGLDEFSFDYGAISVDDILDIHV